MKYFRSDGRRYRDVGVARPGSRARKTAVLSVGTVVVASVVFALFFLGVMKEEGRNMMPVFLIIAATSAVGIGVVIFITRHHLGGGGVSIDMGTGRVELRDKTGSGFSRTRLERTDIREVIITRRTTGSGIKFTVRIISSIGSHVVAILDQDGNAREFAGELASLLAVPMRDDTAGREEKEEDFQEVAAMLKRDHPVLFRLLGRFIEQNRRRTPPPGWPGGRGLEE